MKIFERIDWKKNIKLVLVSDERFEDFDNCLVDLEELIICDGVTFQKLWDYELEIFLDLGLLQCIAEDLEGNELLHAWWSIKKFNDYFTLITSGNLEVSDMIKNILNSLCHLENKYPNKKLSIEIEFYALK